MNSRLRQIIVKLIVPLLDVLLAPFTLLASVLLKFIRRAGMARAPVSKSIFRGVGVFPLIDHYYEPMFDYRQLKRPLHAERDLPGIDWNVPEQLALLGRLNYGGELTGMPQEPAAGGKFYYNNGNFGAGDAEYFYSIMRSFKPARLVEIGAGFSTLMARNAVARNAAEQPGYACKHICIEPYEMPWLESLPDVTVVRDRVETCAPDLFAQLDRNDILFIDSSHMIRPQGDVLFEYLELLPRLRPGVLVHVHDIFSPRDYPARWLEGEVKFWNEQYLLEAFLSCNGKFRIIAALNYLFHNHADRLLEKCPVLKSNPGLEPGSFWMVRA